MAAPWTTPEPAPRSRAAATSRAWSPTRSPVKSRPFAAYGWYLRKYISDAKAKGATPIVLSLVPRKIWKDGKIARASNDYAKWAAEAARAEGVAFVDLNDIVARHYEELGPEKVNGTLR